MMAETRVVDLLERELEEAKAHLARAEERRAEAMRAYDAAREAFRAAKHARACAVAELRQRKDYLAALQNSLEAANARRLAACQDADAAFRRVREAGIQLKDV